MLPRSSRSLCSPRSLARRLALSSAPLALVLAACGAPIRTPSAPLHPPAPAPPGPTTADAQATPPPSTPPTVEEARAFVDDLERQLRELWVARDRAHWVAQTYITVDTEALRAAGEATTAAFITRKAHEAQRFASLPLPDDLARKLHLLVVTQQIPAPSDAAKAKALADTLATMDGAYGEGKYCPPKGSKLTPLLPKGETCFHLDDLDGILQKSRDVAVLTEAWNGWHATARPQRDRYTKFVDEANEGAKELGFADVGALWRSNFDMTPIEVEAEADRLWSEVKPLYDELHCYVRAKLRAKYGKDKVPEHGPIPAELLGNMWAQGWEGIFDFLVPYKGEPSLDVSRTLREKKIDAKAMVKMGESFFTSLGFDPLPETFWERSQFVRPRDREVLCHAYAWDVTWSGDLRIKMCIEPDEDNLVTIDHELGHDFYYQQYDKLPILFQFGANDGFQEGLGDTIALSVTPAYLKSRGLLATLPTGDKSRINELMKRALSKVAFLPFALRVDKWRWDVFAKKITPDHYNAAWWNQALAYQGIAPPEARTEDDFDPASKYHVASATPYLQYFLAAIYQFQFHRALCKASGFEGPLDECSIYQSTAAGQKLKAMMSMGASKPWQDAMQAISGERQGDAGAILEYFAPLRAWLKDQIKDEKCGW